MTGFDRLAVVSLFGAVVGAFLLLGIEGAGSAASPLSNATATGEPATLPPVLAYYYIWYDQPSWNRAKTDYPLLGRYASSQPDVMRQHIQWAKAAGIDGFIVSWKNTDVLQPRLAQLVEIARQENFKLAIIYQGLDFERKPLPVDRIASDLDFFTQKYADDPVFRIFDKPLVIWSGTWKFSREDIGGVTQPRRNRLLLLASEKNVAGYDRVADVVDGDAYYWSSVDPTTNASFGSKLSAMATIVRQHGGIWIAPAAPGFDARLVGGTRVVDRRDGATLREEFGAAISAKPDAVGLISWNEFSENSQVEPSCRYGSASLTVLASLLGGTGPRTLPACPERLATAATPVRSATPSATPSSDSALIPAGPSPQPADSDFADVSVDADFDSSSPDGRVAPSSRLPWMGFVVLTAFSGVTLMARRNRRRHAWESESNHDE